MSQRLGVIPTRLFVRAAMLAGVVLIGLAVTLHRHPGPPPLPTPGSLRMPIMRTALDRTVTIGARPEVITGNGSRLDIESRYGQFRGHWWWNHGWVYVSGSALPGARIHVHLDNRSLTITDIPDRPAVTQISHYGRYGFLDFIQVDVVRFGIGATLLSNRTTGGPFAGGHVFDQIEGRAWTERGLLITRLNVASAPVNAVRCIAVTQPVSTWDLGCPMFGQRPLVADRHGRFGTVPESIVDAKAVSLTPTPAMRTRLPSDSLRVEW